MDLGESRITFRGSSDKKEYEFDYELFGEVVVADCKWEKTGFHMRFILAKKDPSWWVRLVKDGKKNTYIQCDWDKWVDEDEEDESANKGMGGWDPSAMQGFGGEGFGGEDDSDDEGGLDDLKPEKMEEEEEKKAE